MKSLMLKQRAQNTDLRQIVEGETFPVVDIDHLFEMHILLWSKLDQDLLTLRRQLDEYKLKQLKDQQM